jgi:ParB family chromosome partitioning protein
MTITAPAIGTTSRIPLGDFVVDANIRKDTKIPQSFTASVKRHGVLVPVEAYLNADDGKWHLQDGQLRYLASLDSSHADIPVLVVDPAAAEATRIQRQLILNERRNELTESDRVGAFQTLFDLGVSPDQIARQTSTPAKRVQTALQVSASPAASAALATVPITLEHAAALVEFEDAPDILETLTKTAVTQPSSFEHQAERFRVQYAAELAKTALETELAREGYPLIDAGSYYSGKTLRIDLLFTGEKLTKPLAAQPTDKLPVTTPGIAAYVNVRSNWINGVYTETPEAYFVIQDWADAGFHAQSFRLNDSNSTNAGGGLTDEQKNDRRITRENNKLWRPATTVRVAWVKKFLQRKELPADALTFAATYFGRLPNWSTSQRTVFNDWLDIGSKSDSTKYLANNPKHALNVLVAGALAAAEGDYDFGKDGWRRAAAAPYLKQLNAWGYTLSEIEQAVVAGTADKGI